MHVKLKVITAVACAGVCYILCAYVFGVLCCMFSVLLVLTAVLLLPLLLLLLLLRCCANADRRALWYSGTGGETAQHMVLQRQLAEHAVLCIPQGPSVETPRCGGRAALKQMCIPQCSGEHYT
jgi:hypothetical protein